MADFGHDETDRLLGDLEKRISSVYGKAAHEIQDTIEEYFRLFEKRDAEMLKLLEAGEITSEHYKQWRLAQIGRGRRFEALRDKLAERMTNANETAVAYVNDSTPGIYSLNRNYAAYTIEQYSEDVDFTLWDEQTVKRLIVEQPDLMPSYPKERAVKRGIDLAYGKKQITAQVTTGILMGESLKKLADRLQTNIPDMNRKSAIRAARTATTGAENAGRLDSYYAAERMGIELKKQWLATLDLRTRHSHAMIDKEVVGIHSKFSNGLMYPGDTSGRPEEVYNCRCRMETEIPGVELGSVKRRARNPLTGRNEIIDEVSYSEWFEKKRSEDPQAFDIAVKRTKNTSSDKSQYTKYQGELGKNAPKTFADFQKIKYSDNWGAYKVYASSIRTGELTPLSSFSHYQKVSRSIDAQLVGKKTSDGIVITGKSNHFIARVIGSVEQKRNGVEIADVLKAILTPTEKRIYKNSKQYRYETVCAVTINPETGILVQTNPLHKK